MNKILTLLIALVVFYQSFSPLVRIFTRKKPRRKEYKLNFSKGFHHLFSATLLVIIPLLCVINYYQYYSQFAFPVKIVLIVLLTLCWIGAFISFYLYNHYKNKTSYQSLIYDPKQTTIDFLVNNNRMSIKFKDVRGVEWISIKNWLKVMPWSNFEYLVLELVNGKKVIITSLMMAPAQLHSLLDRFELIEDKKIIPTIR